MPFRSFIDDCRAWWHRGVVVLLGAALVFPAFAQNNVSMMFDTGTTALLHVRSGKLRGIAVGEERIAPAARASGDGSFATVPV